MKLFGRTFTITILLIIAKSINAMDCIEFSIEDHGDHVEAVCFGKPQTTKNNSINKVYQQPSQVESQLKAQQQSQNAMVNMINSCKFLQANHYDVGRNPYVDVEVGCELTGRSFQYVEFLLHGLSSTGDRLVTTDMSGYFNADGVASLKKTFPVEYGKFINTRKWEPDRANSSVIIATGYIFNEKDLLQRTAQIQKEITERENRSSGSWGNRDYITMKKGINFSHGSHQRRFSCSSCHNNSSGGPIAGFGKDFAHRKCKGCHVEMKEGPTSCKDCHK